jgi:chitin biosynthesis protein CHS5
MSQANLQHTPTNTANPAARSAANRASLPTPLRVTSTSPPHSALVNQPSANSEPRARSGGFEPTPEEFDGDAQDADATLKGATSAEKEARRKSRPGTMDRNFKFPTTSPPPPPPAVPDLPSSNKRSTDEDGEDDAGLTSVGVVAPSSVEVPPPPPVEKERVGQAIEEGEEDVGETEEIALN